MRSWWIGPCLITAKIGEMSYEIEIKPNHRVSLHRSQLKPHFEDEFAAEKLQLHHFSPQSTDFDSAPDEWEVEKIITHRKDSSGRLEFLTMWKDCSDVTWEPLMQFIHRYSSGWRDYVLSKGLKFNLVDYMSNSERSSVSQSCIFSSQ